jgi:ATP-binding cassette, subfamily B, bacterial
MSRGPHGRRMLEERQRSSDFGALRDLIPFLLPHRWMILGAMVALLVAAASVLFLGVGLRRLVDDGLSGGDPALLDRALVVMFVVIVVMATATFCRFFLVSWIGERLVADLRRAAYDHVIGLDAGFFETTSTGEILSRLTTDTTLLQTVVGSSLSIAMRHMLMLVGGVAMLVVTSPRMAGMVALVVPLVVIPIVVFGRRVRRLSRETQDRVADLGSHAEESLGNIRTVQAFCHEETDRRGFRHHVEEAFAAALRRVRARATLSVSVIVLVFGAVGLILWKGGHDMLAGAITPGEISAFIFYSLLVSGSAGALSEVLADLQRAAGAIERLMELLRTRPAIAVAKNPVPLPQPPRGAVAFEDILFHYPSRPDTATLKDFSLSVEPGETVALVGTSGAGKTTVFSLLLRFYDPRSGRILLDGVDLKQADPLQARARLGLVAQEPVIFAANAWDNIRYGSPDADDAAVRAAAEAAAATEFLDPLPQGFDSFLGEKGVRLSGGQRQRIAIARAILRDPAVLLLDEATSALDAENERLVQAALDRLMHGRTTLIIAHRLATVLNADRIAVIDQGKIAATGTHAELQASNPLYARLAALQFEAGHSSEV